jgi:hypothetical protein
VAGVVGLEPTQIDLEDRYPIPLGDTPVFGDPDRTCSRSVSEGDTYDILFVRKVLFQLSYRTTRASDRTRTHALRLADSDASRYITLAYFGANDEIRTRTQTLEAFYAAITSHSHSGAGDRS